MKKGRVMSVILATAITFSTFPFGIISTNAENANSESAYVFDANTFDSHRELERELENECVVLIKNDARADGTKKMLPLSLNSDKIAVFGEGQINPPGGGGSSGLQGRYVKSLKNGLDAINAPYFKELTSYVAARTGDTAHGWDTSVGEWGENISSGTGWNMTSKVQNPEAKYTDEIVASAAAYADTAVVYISRSTGTEEMDRNTTPQPGDWYLNTSEKDMLQKANDNFDNVIIIFVGTAPICMSQFDAYSNIRAFLIEYGAAQHHGDALAGVLYGSVNPSGKLNDTLAYEYSDHPTSENFGYTSYASKGYDWAANDALYSARKFSDADPISAYEEYIYMGYKYFDTFNVTLAYPFGFGLSYSDFEFSNLSISASTTTKNLTVNATITNTTADASIIAGKEVMQVYVSKPQGELEQAYQNLIGFNKTDALAQGASQTLTVTVPIKDIASYSERLAAYVLEAGDYIIRVGNSSRNTHVAGKLHVDETFIVEQLSNELSMDSDNVNTYNTNRLKYENATPITYAGEAEEIASASVITIDASYVDQNLTVPTVTDDVFEVKDTDKTYKFKAVVDGDVTPEEFVAQFSDEELTNIVAGGVGSGTVVRASDDDKIVLSTQKSKIAVTNGAGFSRAVDRLGLPSLGYADGGSGIWFTDESGDVSNTGWPRPAGFACSWNPNGYYEMGKAMGAEMLACNVDNWLAPAINMHRYPFGGRNLEYWSEDPVLTGTAASNVARGVAESGVTVCLKHFAANDQEWFRRGYYTQASGDESKAAINVIAPERVLREIYLKPFEMAVKTGCVYNIMSAFNTINGQPCAASPDLLTDILRGEWGFEGYVVTDWGDYDDIANSAYEMAAGNDMIMSGVHTRYSIYNELVAGLKGGAVTREQLLRNVRNVVVSAKHSALATDKSKHVNPGDLRIAISSLPNAIIGVDYTELKANPIWANGSVDAKSYTFSLAEGSELPTGMSLRGDGRICGVPSSGQSGKYLLNVKVEDDLGNSAIKPLYLTVEPNFAFTTLTLSDAKVNTEYSQTINGKNYMDTTMVLSVKAGNVLPDGLSFDGQTISGTPTKSGIYTFTIVATDGTNTAEKEYTLLVEGDETLTPASGSVIEVSEGAVISETITTDGDISIYGSSVLPAGLNFENGVISGMPQIGTLGEYEFIIVVTKNGEASYYKYTLRVLESDSITKTLSHAKASVEYNETINTGLTNPVFTLASGTLPSGIALTQDGKLTGVPAATESGIYPLTVSVESESSSYTFNYELYVEGVLNFDPAVDTVFELAENTPFTQVIDASGGTERYTFEITDGALPEGINFTVAADNGSITVSGTPTSAGIYTVTYTVDDYAFAGSPVTSVARYTFEVKTNTEIMSDSATDIICENFASASDGVTLNPTSDNGGGDNAVKVPTGETVTYNINVAKTKPYYLSIRSAQQSESVLSFYLDGEIIGHVTISSSQGIFNTNEDVEILVLTEGQHTFEVKTDSGEVDLNIITFNGVDDADVKLNHFAQGGRVAMSALDYTVIGGNARVSGTNVGFLDPPAYMYYFVRIKQPGNYNLYAKTNGCGGGKFDLYVDGELKGTVNNTVNTGYGGNYEYNAPISVYLDSGYHMFKTDITQSGMNLHSIELEYTDGKYPTDKYIVKCDDNTTFEADIPDDGLFTLESANRGGYFVVSADKEVGTKLEVGEVVNVTYGKPVGIFDKHTLKVESVVSSGGDYIITYNEDTMKYTVKPNITDGSNTVMGNSNYIKLSFGSYLNAANINFMKIGIKASGSMAKAYDNVVIATINGTSAEIWGWFPSFNSTTGTYVIDMNSTFKRGDAYNYVNRTETDLLQQLRIKCSNGEVMTTDGSLEISYVAFFETAEQANSYVYDPMADICKLTVMDGDTVVYETNITAGTTLDSSVFASQIAKRPGYSFVGFDVSDGTVINKDTVVNTVFKRPTVLYNHVNFALDGALVNNPDANNDLEISLVSDGTNKYAHIANKVESGEVTRTNEDQVVFNLMEGTSQSYTIGEAHYAAIGYRTNIEKPVLMLNYLLNDSQKSQLWEPVHTIEGTSEFTNFAFDLHTNVYGGSGNAAGLSTEEIIALMDSTQLYGFKLSPYRSWTSIKQGETLDILYIALFETMEAAQNFVYDPNGNTFTITIMDGDRVIDTVEVLNGQSYTLNASKYAGLVTPRPGVVFAGFDVPDGTIITEDTVVNAIFEAPKVIYTYNDFIVDGMLVRNDPDNNRLFIEAQTDGTYKYARIYNKLDESVEKTNADLLRFKFDDSTSDYTLENYHYVAIGYRTNIQDSPRFTFNYSIQSSEYEGRPQLWEPRSELLTNSDEFEKCVFDLTSGIYGGWFNGSLNQTQALEYFNKSAMYLLSLTPYTSGTIIRPGEYMDIEYIALFDSLEKANSFVYKAPKVEMNPITFYDEDGTTVLYESTDYTIGENVTFAAPIKAGKVFVGWTVPNSNGIQRVTNDFVATGNSKSYTALYRLNTSKEDFIFDRANLDNTYVKLTQDKALTVAYIGGSVTVGAGASNSSATSWRALTREWFKTNYPEATITEVNAGIGGTGSRLGAYRLSADVLAHNPDLVFVEFAINDAYFGETPQNSSDSTANNEGTTAKYYESVIRQIRETLPNTDIIVLFTTDKGQSKSVMFKQAEVQNAVAEHYGITSIDMGRYLQNTIDVDANGNDDEWYTYVTDVVHPYDTGYDIYADNITTYLSQELNSSSATEQTAHTVPSTYYSVNAQKLETSYVAVTDSSVTINENATLDSNTRLGNAAVSTTVRGIINLSEGAKITVNFTGTEFGIFMGFSGKYDTKLAYVIKNGDTEVASNSDVTCGDTSLIKLVQGLENNDYTIELTFTDVGEGQALGAFLVGGEKEYDVTVTFDLNGGTSSDKLTVTLPNGGTLSQGDFPNAELENKVLFDWFTTSTPSAGTRVTTSTIFETDTTVYAVWDDPVERRTDVPDMSFKTFDKAYISFIFDDNGSDLNEFYEVITGEYGYPICAAVPAKTLENGKNAELLQDIQAHGGEILSHGYSHKVLNRGVLWSEVEYEFAKSQEVFESYGLNVNGVITAGGGGTEDTSLEYRTEIEGITAKYFDYGTWAYGIKPQYSSDRYSVTASQDVNTLKNVLNQMIDGKKWVQFTAHNTSEFPIELLREFMEVLKAKEEAGLVEVITYKTAYETLAEWDVTPDFGDTTYTVEFYLTNGLELATSVTACGKTPTLPEMILPTGKKIASFNTNADGSGNSYAADLSDFVVTNNIKLYAILETDSDKPVSTLIGDTNGDGEVAPDDAVILCRYIAKWGGYETIYESNSDLNADGKINLIDAIILSRHLAEWTGYESLPIA